MEDFYNCVFNYVLECYVEQKFCDVHIYAKVQDGATCPSTMNRIKCHAIVLASVAPALTHVLLAPDSVETEDGQDFR